MKFLRVARRVPEAQSQPQATRNYPAGAMGLKGYLAEILPEMAGLKKNMKRK